MSMLSVEDFDPSSSKPVFGSNVTQTKTQEQQKTMNDVNGKEKLLTPPQSTVNGQNETTNDKNSDNLSNGNNESTLEKTNGSESTTVVHVNGQNGDVSVDAQPSVNGTTKDHVNPVEDSLSASEETELKEKSSQNDPLPSSANEPTNSVTSTDPAIVQEPGTALSVSEGVVREDLSSAPANDANKAAPPPPGPPEEVTSATATTSNESVPASATAPEATVLAESSTPERKGKSPRSSKAKSPVVSTPPTRQSTRAKKTASTSPTEDDEKQSSEDPGASTALAEPSPKRVKRQAATIAEDAIQATSTSGSDPTDEVEENPKRKTPSPRKGASTSVGRKRGASSSPSVSPAKKKKVSPKGTKVAPLSNDEQQMDVDTAGEVNDAAVPSETETVQTPPQKARTSENRKTPTMTTPESSDEYVRKLRPRK